MGMMVMMKKVYKTEIKSASVIKKSFYFFGILHTNHADSVAHLESFRALKLTLSKSFMAHPSVMTFQPLENDSRHHQRISSS